MNKLRVLSIVDGTSVDGPGLRTSVYLAGCNHGCPGCHNPQSHDPLGGDELTVAEILEHIEREGYPVTFSGGDPLLQADNLLPLLRILSENHFNIWLYTGYLFEHIAADDNLKIILPYIDVIVDGPFVLSLRDTSLIFRGSSNQRIIDVKQTLKSGTIQLFGLSSLS